MDLTDFNSFASCTKKLAEFAAFLWPDSNTPIFVKQPALLVCFDDWTIVAIPTNLYSQMEELLLLPQHGFHGHYVDKNEDHNKIIEMEVIYLW